MLPGISGICGMATAPGTAGGGGSEPSSDPYFGNSVLLLSGNGSNGSTTFTDESFSARGNATVNGNTQVTTTSPKFGSGAILFDGTGDNLTFADSSSWTLETGDFTIEGWFWFSASALDTYQVLVSHWQSNTVDRSWTIQYRGDLGTNTLELVGSNTGQFNNLTVTGNWTPTGDTWHFIAVDRDSSDKFRIYVDGSMIASATSALEFHNAVSVLRIGSIYSGGETGYFNGKMDEIRITKGVARYASDSGFSVPAAAFPRS